MKVLCPGCSTQVPAANLDLGAGWGKCEACQELFPLERVVPGFPAARAAGARATQRPFGARAIVERAADQLLIHVPAEGMQAGARELLGFATLCLAFIAFWTAAALGAFSRGPPGAADWVFASFSIPFWLVGFGMLGGVAWRAWGTRSLRIDRGGMRTHQRCLAWSRSRRVGLDRVQHARAYAPPVEAEGPRAHAVEVVYRFGSFVLPADSEDEERWLMAEVNDFVKSLAAEPGAAPDPAT